MVAGVFLASVAGVAAMVGFSRTVMASKREEQKLLEKGVIESVQLLDAGSSLALRALGWGTLYAFLGTGALCYSIWKLSGATNVIITFQIILYYLPILFEFVLCLFRCQNFVIKWEAYYRD